MVHEQLPTRQMLMRQLTTGQMRLDKCPPRTNLLKKYANEKRNKGQN